MNGPDRALELVGILKHLSLKAADQTDADVLREASDLIQSLAASKPTLEDLAARAWDGGRVSSIKNLRSIAASHGFHLGLADARDLIDDHGASL